LLEYLGEMEVTEASLIAFFKYLAYEQNTKDKDIMHYFRAIKKMLAKTRSIDIRKMHKLGSLIDEVVPYNVRHNVGNPTAETAVLKYFTPEQLFEFLELPISTPFASLVKAAVCLAFCGQLTGRELKLLQLEHLTHGSDGLKVNLDQPTLQHKGFVFRSKSFTLRRNASGPCMYRPVRRYLDCLGECGISEGPLFRTCNPNQKTLGPTAYRVVPIGRDCLYTFGRYVAEMLNLPEADSYGTQAIRLAAKYAK